MTILILRLLPEKPVDGVAFTSFLKHGADALRIEAYDVSLGKPVGGDLIGSASYVADLDNPNTPPDPNAFPDPMPDPSTRILQHRRIVPPLPTPPTLPDPSTTTVLQAVATAVIEITRPPSNSHEYVDPDIILKVLRGTTTVATLSVDYNVGTRAGGVPPLADFPGLEPAAAYVQLLDPTKIQPGDATVTLPKDGSPPNFSELLSAVKAVMQADTGVAPTFADIAGLTPAQARHIAFEIGWNRHVDPLPELPVGQLEDAYTLPGADNDANTQNRQRFEAARQVYRVTHDAQSEALAKYVYALGAAFAAEQLSADAASAALTFPAVPDGVIPPAEAGELTGKIQEVRVTLESA